MRKRSRDGAQGTPAPVLTPPLLSAIHDLNSDYLELLIANRGRPLVAALPSVVVAGLADLDAAARRSLAACPFALYSLGVEHQEFWRAGQPASRVAEATPDYFTPLRSVMPLSAENFFGISALFFAWHLASAQRMVAKVSFAMPDFAVEGLARMPLGQLHKVASECTALMRPRWPMNSGFWPDLVRFAARGDLERLNTTQLLGSQLIAADLRQQAALRNPVSPASESLLPFA